MVDCHISHNCRISQLFTPLTQRHTHTTWILKVDVLKVYLLCCRHRQMCRNNVLVLTASEHQEYPVIFCPHSLPSFHLSLECHFPIGMSTMLSSDSHSESVQFSIESSLLLHPSQDDGVYQTVRSVITCSHRVSPLHLLLPHNSQHRTGNIDYQF